MRELTRSRPGARAQRGAERLVAVAESQDGVLHRDQILAAGVSGSTISRWEAANRVHRLFPRVYALGHRALRDEGRLRAALLYAGPDATLSHSTAAWWWRLLDLELRVIHLSVAAKRRPVGGVVIHHPRDLDRTSHRGFPVTTIPRTLVDLAPLVSFARLRRALAEADFQRLADLDAIAAAARRGRRGSRAVRRALALHRPQLARTRSELEERFLALCERHRIPLPEVNVTICGFMVDALWREQRVIVELDGRAAHGTPAAIERDRHRDLTLRAAGYSVLRYTWQQVTRDTRAVAADVLSALRPN